MLAVKYDRKLECELYHIKSFVLYALAKESF